MQRGWVYEPAISNYDSLIFYNALKKHSDFYYYKPIALAKREETGMKYRFLCIAIPRSTPCHPSHFAQIEVYKPQMGMPYVTINYRLEFDKLFRQGLPF